MSSPRRTLVNLLCVPTALLIVTACAVTTPGTPAPAPEPEGSKPTMADVTYDERTAPMAAEFARARTWDLCGMVDVAAAERIMGAQRKDLRMHVGIDDCELELLTPGGDAWRFSIKFGARSEPDWADLDLAGARLKHDPDEESLCEYFLPTAGAAGFIFEGAVSGLGTDSAQTCRTVERYLTEVVIPKAKNPPTLADGRTTPGITLRGKDPCAALAAGAADLPDETDPVSGAARPKTYRMTDAYTCEGGYGTSINDYSVALDLFSGLTDADGGYFGDLEGEQIQVGGLTAYRDDSFDTCSLKVPVGPQIVFDPAERTVYHAGVVIGLPTCADPAATAVAEKILDNVEQQPDAPQPGPDAQALGDLR